VIVGPGLGQPYFDAGTGSWKVCPTDDSLDHTYKFHLYI
jgi:hypothetical protein